MSRTYQNYPTRLPAINWKLPLLLYVLTWLTTSGFRLDNFLLFYQFFLSLLLFPMNPELAHEAWSQFSGILLQGLEFSIPLMFILTCHELGHYIQTRRYGVYSSLPYFIPMPFGPFGTLGAVIAMDGRIPNPKALFDIGISGPLAGLIPTMFCLYFGVKWSYLVPTSSIGEMVFGFPLLFQYLTYWFYGPIPPDVTLAIHPVAKAGWVGLFLTSLNLLPFSQLDGGHVFYALIGRRAGAISWTVFYVIIILVILFQLWHWILILLILAAIGVSHPPTANDSIRLTPARRILGWATLAFVFFGLTPTPISLNESINSTETPRIYCQSDSMIIPGTGRFSASYKSRLHFFSELQ